MHNPIVIIGGMGPQASHRLHGLLLQKSEPFHSGQGHEYPGIMHCSLPIEDFISDRAKATAAVSQINNLSQVVGQLQPAVTVLACNTAHLLVPLVPMFLDFSFVSMIDAVIAACRRTCVQKIGLLASPTTIATGLYATAMAEQQVDCDAILLGCTELPLAFDDHRFSLPVINCRSTF
ncbi:MAG: murI [Candidatus Saccharibacteria bacterium]|nr:murI [Candidatus Saccharibacteria bacterium]